MENPTQEHHVTSHEHQKGATVPESPCREHSAMVSAFLFGEQSYQYVSFTIWTGCRSFNSPFNNSKLISNNLTVAKFQK